MVVAASRVGGGVAWRGEGGRAESVLGGGDVRLQR